MTDEERENVDEGEDEEQEEEYEFEVTATREEAATTLRRVADGVLGGAVRVGESGDAVDVRIPDEMELEVEFETEDDEESLEVELEWSTEAAEPEPDAATGPTASDDTSEGVTSHTTGEPPESASDEPPADEEPPTVTTVDGPASGARFEVFRDRADEWRWRLVHRNGNVIATSGEGYTRKHNAEKGLRSVVRNAPTADIVDTVDSDG